MIYNFKLTFPVVFAAIMIVILTQILNNGGIHFDYMKPIVQSLFFNKCITIIHVNFSTLNR